MSEAAAKKDDTIVTRIHRATRESLDSADERLRNIDSKTLELRKLIRAKPGDSQRNLRAAIAKR